MQNLTAAREYEQIPLVMIVDKDDEILLNTPGAEWYRILRHFEWKERRDLAAAYYDALYDFNRLNEKPPENSDGRDETKEEAARRILAERPTVDKSKPVLFEPETRIPAERIVKPRTVAPGKPPKRPGGGKRPKCFFALYKSFLGAVLMGFPPEPEIVFDLLNSNLSFARVCGFVPKDSDDRYWHEHVPGLRKLEQFDQIMKEYGLWTQEKWREVRTNIETGVVKKENVLVGDTTHYHAYSSFETVEYTDEKGKEKRKSQSKTTKKCGCADKDNCPHSRELADDGAGTIVKSGNRKIWGHKASILGVPLQGIPLDAAAVADGASHDGETLFPHVEVLFDNLPQVEDWTDTVLYDRAADSQKLREQFESEKGVRLRTSVNPRRIKTVTDDLPKGMDKITPVGELGCEGGHEMDYKGVRFDTEKFVFAAPTDENGKPVCADCEHKPVCCPLAEKGRVVTIPFDTLPHIDPNDPPMAKRFKAMMVRRISVERMIKRMKCDLSDDRLRKRGNASFQAYLDKTLIAFHILLRA